MRCLWSIAVCLCICLLVPACFSGPKLVKLNGRLTRDGQPLKLPALAMVQLSFVPVVEEGTVPAYTYSAHFDRETSSFTVLGIEGKGVPVGKYRISIQQHIADAPAEIAEMNQRFGKESPLILDIADERSIIVDLGKGTVE